MPSKPGLVNNFFKMEASGGLMLMGAAVIAMILANTPLRYVYELVLTAPVEVRFGALEIAKPLLLWINDGLMAIFFFLVGLELKRELMEGELADKRNIILPGVGAIGGMAVPALIYLYFNIDDPQAVNGWAIPAATDIAFALGVLSLLGSRVPVSLKIFLTSLAIFDDVGAIIIIAIFYTVEISKVSLIIVACCIPVLVILNSSNVVKKTPYIIVGLVVWVATLKSGVHATLAGVLLAMFIPMRSKDDPDISPVKSLEHDLHALVAFFVLPVFALANAGIDFTGLGAEQVLHPVPVGIALGLILGKQLGVFGLCWLVIKLGLVGLPKGMSWLSLYGTAALCGIGFTMSLFIGSLAFDVNSIEFFDERLGIIIGSLVSGIIGYVVLSKSLKSNSDTVNTAS
jgi:NhaA family Na+:H+ antiporter